MPASRTSVVLNVEQLNITTGAWRLKLPTAQLAGGCTYPRQTIFLRYRLRFEDHHRLLQGTKMSRQDRRTKRKTRLPPWGRASTFLQRLASLTYLERWTV